MSELRLDDESLGERTALTADYTNCHAIAQVDFAPLEQQRRVVDRLGRVVLHHKLELARRLSGWNLQWLRGHILGQIIELEADWAGVAVALHGHIDELGLARFEPLYRGGAGFEWKLLDANFRFTLER